MRQFRTIIEHQAFGVCSYWGEKFHIPVSRIRMYFIYASFMTFGSPVIVYLIMAFFLNLKDYIREGDRSVWEL